MRCGTRWGRGGWLRSVFQALGLGGGWHRPAHQLHVRQLLSQHVGVTADAKELPVDGGWRLGPIGDGLVGAQQVLNLRLKPRKSEQQNSKLAWPHVQRLEERQDPGCLPIMFMFSISILITQS